MKNPCNVCRHGVHSCHKSMFCASHKGQVHLKCTSFTKQDLNNTNWFCTECMSNLFPFNWIEDEQDFLNNILNLSYCAPTDSFTMNNLRRLNLLNRIKPVAKEIDPDSQLGYEYLSINDSYFSSQEFNECIIDNEFSSNLSILHLNIRSLNRNLSNLLLFLDSLKGTLLVIALSETWENSSNTDLSSIPGYDKISNFSDNNRNGGVSLFIHQNLKYSVREDLKSQTVGMDNFTSAFVEIINEYKRKIVVGVIYRPPGYDVDKFNRDFDLLLVKLNKSRSKFVLAGDYNINLLNSDSHSSTGDFLNNLFSHSCYPTISRPTRLCSTTSTLIDNIFTNLQSNLNRSGLFLNDITDHLPIFSILDFPLNTSKVTDKKFVVKHFKQINDNSIKKLNEELSKTDWNIIYNLDDVNLAYNTFLHKFNAIYDKCVPTVTKKIFLNKCFKPWITPCTKKSINKKKLYKFQLVKNVDLSKSKYKHYKNNFTFKSSRKKNIMQRDSNE